jgi:hypothetical protein
MATSSGCFRTDEHGHDGTQSPAPHVGDSHDLIRVLGARVNNLKDVSVEITKRRLTVFTGVSGSGKSSLVFGTIAAESQRLINEYPRHGRDPARIRDYPQPCRRDAGLSTASTELTGPSTLRCPMRPCRSHGLPETPRMNSMRVLREA